MHTQHDEEAPSQSRGASEGTSIGASQGQKRQRIHTLVDGRRRMPPPEVRDLPTYYGRTIEEAQAFISGAERRFWLDRGYYYGSDQEKIDFCVLAFAEYPKRLWTSYEKGREQGQEQEQEQD
jgi:hypothetical protein